MKRNYVFLADGFEELEAVTVIDLLSRAGLCVETVSTKADTLSVTGAHGIVVEADEGLDKVDPELADWMIVPGGMDGTTNLAANAKVCELLKGQSAKGGRIAAICAAPAIVLAPLGIVKGHEVTVYPGLEDKCREGGARMLNVPVVTDGPVVTGNGPAAAMEFALAIIDSTVGTGVSKEVAGALLYDRDR